MTDKDASKDISFIPVLNGTNFSAWKGRMKIHLRSKDLLDVCEKEPSEDASAAIVNKWNKASYEAVGIITSRINQTVFIEVMDKYTEDNACHLWTKINAQYASTTALNRGRVWVEWEALSYGGDLQSFIQKCRKTLLEVASVNIQIPDNILSYLILGNCAKIRWPGNGQNCR